MNDENPRPAVRVIACTVRNPVEAAALLIFTKSTRLRMSPGGLAEMVKKCRDDWAWAEAELRYMARTIRSSWEFLDITFSIQNVSRACAQQMTRTRLASYAMQSQRVTNLTGSTFHVPDFENPDERHAYLAEMNEAMNAYERLIASGMKPEDARGVLPMNVHCNLIAKYNLRTLVDLIGARTSYRVQGEYQEVAHQMAAELTQLWPWTQIFLKPRNAIACELVDELLAYLEEGDLIPGQKSWHEIQLLAAKIKDQLEGK